MAEQTLGHYRLVRLLGQGGFAEVYLGEHIHRGTQAAVKVLHTRLADEDVLAFKQEAQMVARLLHPNIVRVLDFGVEGAVPYLVMDYAPAGTLRYAFPKGSRVPLHLVVACTKQVAEALQCVALTDIVGSGGFFTASINSHNSGLGKWRGQKGTGSVCQVMFDEMPMIGAIGAKATKAGL